MALNLVAVHFLSWSVKQSLPRRPDMSGDNGDKYRGRLGRQHSMHLRHCIWPVGCPELLLSALQARAETSSFPAATAREATTKWQRWF